MIPVVHTIESEPKINSNNLRLIAFPQGRLYVVSKSGELHKFQNPREIYIENQVLDSTD